jgi:hypothetical protein
MPSRRRALSQERGFGLAEDHGKPARPLGVLSEEDDRLRKKAYKIVKLGFRSYQEDYDSTINVMPADDWEVDKKTNFLHIPFRIDTFPSCGLFEKYFKRKFGDKRAVVEYDKGDVFILKLDWEKLLLPDSGFAAIVRQNRRYILAGFFVLLVAWYYLIWTTSRRVIKE